MPFLPTLQYRTKGAAWRHQPVTLLLGDCVDRMRELPTEAVDAIVTDPPYGINFMGKAWDRKAIEEAVARPVPLDGVTRLTGSPESPNRKLIQRTGSAFANQQVKQAPMTSPRKETMPSSSGVSNGVSKRSAF